MRFPQTFIDELRRQADIVRVVSDYVSLKKKGANWMACCPFHQEKTPSFSVNPAKDIYYCFGCGKGGSVFSFVMEIEGLSFPEAIKVVAEKTGVALPAMVEDKKFEARKQEADEVIELNSWALDWWEAQLWDGAGGVAAREYLNRREVAEDTRKVFRLGYAPESWDALLSHLKKKGASLSQIERSGLVVKKDAGGFYDRFRGRLIFPVLDAQGRAIAFGGRTLQADTDPKYLNSPETAAYTKGKHLFGLNISREEIRRRKFAILVEGYLDLIVPYQFGIRNMVASLGTALTGEQAKLLGRFARKVVVNYDGDKAGLKAARRAVETLLAEDFEVKVLILPQGTDPDEFIKQNGAEEYNRRRGEALSHIEFVLDQATRDRNLHHPSDKAAAVEEVIPTLRAVRNTIQKREYFDMAMDALRINERALRNDLWQAVRANTQNTNEASVQQKLARATGAQPTLAERQLLELLFADAELRRAVLPQLEATDYEELPTARIFRALIELDQAGLPVDFAALTEKTMNDAVAEELLPLLLMSESPRAEGEALDESQRIAESCLTALRLMRVDRRITELGTEIASAERAGDSQRSSELSTEYIAWTRRRNALLPHVGAASPGLS
jgi:DNA primase